MIAPIDSWFLKYIRQQKEAPQFYSSYGSFMHKLIEEFYNGKITKEDMKIKFLFDFQKEVKGERPKETTLLKYISSGLKYLDEFSPLPYEMLGVEKKITFDIDGIPFIGYIDYLGEKDGELYIVDNKSRELKPRSKGSKKGLKKTLKDEELDEMLRQLYIYAHGVKQEYGKFPKSLCFNCFRNGVFIEEPFNEDAYKEALDWVKKNIEMIKSADDFYPNVDFFTCKYICGLSDDCCYWEMR